ncbi:hypothetical protein C1Y32_16840 [Pseudomonas sp. FW126-L8]|nr:hypothetical protein C1Y32_16840 [Pseudomonas sp. FW126-L8]
MGLWCEVIAGQGLSIPLGIFFVGGTRTDWMFCQSLDSLRTGHWRFRQSGPFVLSLGRGAPSQTEQAMAIGSTVHL